MSLRLVPLLLLTACATSPGDDGGPQQPADPWACPQVRSLATQCGDILNEPIYVTLIDRSSAQANEVGVLGAVSGNTCTLQKFSATNSIDHVSSLAVLGTDVFYCASPDANAAGILTRVSLVDGTVTLSGVSCLSVASFDDHLLVMSDNGATVTEYASFDAVLAKTPTVKSLGDVAVRLGAGESYVYSTGTTTDVVHVWDPATGTSSQMALPMTGITVTGLAAQKGQIAILDGMSYDQWIYNFDADTGAAVGRVVAATQVTRLHGLSNACKLPAFE